MRNTRYADSFHGDANWRAAEAHGGARSIDASRFASIVRQVGHGGTSPYLRSIGLPQRDEMGLKAAHMKHTTASYRFDNGKDIPITFLTPRHGGRYVDDYLRAVTHAMRVRGQRGGHVELILHRGAEKLEIPSRMASVSVSAARGANPVINNLILGVNTRSLRLNIASPTYLSSRNADGRVVAESLESVRARGVNIEFRGAANAAHAELRDVSIVSTAAPTSVGAVYGNINRTALNADQLYHMTHPTPARNNHTLRDVVYGAARRAAEKARQFLLMPPEPLHRSRDAHAQLAA